MRAFLASAVLFAGGLVPAPPPRTAVEPVIPLKAAPFALDQVRLLDGPFRDAQETCRAYLLQLDPDRLLAPLWEACGGTPKADPYGGWDAGSGQLGHYLTACAQMAAATGDSELRVRVEYIASELAGIQKLTGGAVYCTPAARQWFDALMGGSIEQMFATPWYSVHKTMAGLRDAWLICGSRPARDALIAAGDWCIRATSGLTDDGWQEMLGPPSIQGEHGGPHEVLADIYAITGASKYLTCAQRFRHNYLFEPLARGDASVMDGRHANTQFPKFIGYERIYQLSGEPIWHDAARNFWVDVVTCRSWVNGGNSQNEAFLRPTEFEAKVLDPCGPETCNTYNMLRLTEALYAADPTSAYVDYYERALYNSILPSQAPDGGFVYYTSMRPGHYRVYSRPFDAFWCCVGTGMENHGKYGKMIYAAGRDRLLVNLFIASELRWRAAGLRVRQQTLFPEEPRTPLRLTLDRPRRFTLSIRHPQWAAPHGLTVSVNGQVVPATVGTDGYVDLDREWQTGDTIEVEATLTVHEEMLPGSRNYVAFLYGPVLLAGALGSEGLTREDFYGDGSGALATRALPLSEAPAIVGCSPEVARPRLEIGATQLRFRPLGVRPAEVTAVPFYSLHHQRYVVYWPLLTQEAYAERQAAADRERAEAQGLEMRTIDRVIPGYAPSEVEHHIAWDRSNTGPALPPYTSWRDATGWFSYVLRVLPDEPVALWIAYYAGDAGRVFTVSADGVSLATQELTGGRPAEYLHVTYNIPRELTRGKESITVRFDAEPGSLAGGVFDCRVVRRR